MICAIDEIDLWICEWIYDDYECLYSVDRVDFINYASAVDLWKNEIIFNLQRLIFL